MEKIFELLKRQRFCERARPSDGRGRDLYFRVGMQIPEADLARMAEFEEQLKG